MIPNNLCRHLLLQLVGLNLLSALERWTELGDLVPMSRVWNEEATMEKLGDTVLSP